MTLSAKAWHALTAVVAAAALTLQLVLVVNGAATLFPEQEPSLAVRVVRFFSYFTILSNILVLVTAVSLVRAVPPSGRGWRVLRLDAVAAITVTAVVHWLLLRPLLDLEGLSAVADTLLHVVVPVLAVLGWVVLGPHGQLALRDVLPAMAFPVAWLGYTLAHGAATGWYPYPFIDVGELGLPRALVNAVGVAGLLLVVCAVVVRVDRARARRTAGGVERSGTSAGAH